MNIPVCTHIHICVGTVVYVLLCTRAHLRAVMVCSDVGRNTHASICWCVSSCHVSDGTECARVGTAVVSNVGMNVEVFQEWWERKQR